jgi:O-antigen/teichoic acid export membrane protein
LAASFGLRSTGLLVFAGRIVSAFTGLLFTVMAARWLGPSGLGTWEVIVTVVAFATGPVGIVAYWTTRDVARGRMLGRTALAAGMLLSVAGLLVYSGFSYFTYSRIASSTLPFVLGGLLVPLSYWSGVASSLVTGYRPAVYGYSLLVSEVAKVAAAYELLYVYQLGIDGVLVALMVAYLVQALFSTFMVRGSAAEAYHPPQIRRWMKLAWLPALVYLPNLLGVADTYLVALIHGTAVVGTYQVAFSVATIVTYATSLAFSMYPLLLRGGDQRLPGASLEYSMLLAIPLATGCIALSGPILLLFGSSYVPGALGLDILAVALIFNNVSLLLDQTLMGTEKVDTGETPSFRRLVRSNLFFVPVVNISYGIAYLVALSAAMAYAASAGLGVSADVAIWASVQLGATAAFMLVKLTRARRVARLAPGVSVVYYAVAAGAMGVAVRISSPLVASRSLGTLAYGAHLVGLVALGGAVYFAAVYALDPKFRGMARALLRVV